MIVTSLFQETAACASYKYTFNFAHTYLKS